MSKQYEKGLTQTPNPIEYECYKTGPKGPRFILYPNQGTPGLDVKIARDWLIIEKNAEYVAVKHKGSDDHKAMPDKLSPEMIIQALKIELGQAKAYIEELKDGVVKERIVKDRELRLEVKSQQMYKDLQKQLAAAKKEIISLRSQISDLVTRLNHKEK